MGARRLHSLTVEGFLPIFFLGVVLKIPIAAALLLIWYAVRAEPEAELPDEGEHGFRRWRPEPRRRAARAAAPIRLEPRPSPTARPAVASASRPRRRRSEPRPRAASAARARAKLARERLPQVGDEVVRGLDPHESRTRSGGTAASESSTD